MKNISSYNNRLQCQFQNEYLGDRLQISVESIHLADRGDTENALKLTPDQLKLREVVLIDIAEDLGPKEEAELLQDEIPRLFHSEKTIRGPLAPNWIRTVNIIQNFKRHY